MKKWTLLSIVVIILLALPSCIPAETTKTPEKPSLEEEMTEEERAAESIATTKAEKTQSASTVSNYAEISDDEQAYLAFWFTWNDETVFLPIAKGKITGMSLAACQSSPNTTLAIGKLFSGQKISGDECVPDEQAPDNAMPVIKIPGYFEDGVKADELNIIDLHGDYAESFSDIVTFIIENDLLGSGDLTISLHRTDGFNGSSFSDEENMPIYTLPAEALQVTFSSEQLANLEYADDVVYALERAFTWKIPAGNSYLVLSPGDDNWFVLEINESGREPTKTFIQIIGVGVSKNP